MLNDEFVYEVATGCWAGSIGVRQEREGTASNAVIASGRRYQVANLSTNLDVETILRTEQSLTAIGLPLRVREAAIGVLWIARGEPFASAELQLLDAMADLASAAIHRTLLHEQTQQQLRRLTSLRSIDLAISTSHNLQATLGVVVDQVIGQLEVDATAILLTDPYEHSLGFAAGGGFRTELAAQTHIRVSEGFVGMAALEQRPVHLSVVPTTEWDSTRGPLLAAEGFIAYSAVPLVFKGQLQGLLEVFHRAPLRRDAAWFTFLEMLAGQTAIAVENSTLFTRLQRAHAELLLAYDSTLEGWARALELRDDETQGHSRRVTALTVRLGHALGLSDDTLRMLRRGALLHDIGKMGIPDAILRKPGPLDEVEWEIMRRHPDYAVNLLAPIAFLQPALDIPHYHHERWDGSGYPRQLKGQQIPLAARIFSVVDVWDAMTNDRPYRAAVPDSEARQYLQDHAGILFDPDVVTAFLHILDD
jgi:HD-GYP domain-containing protein (c-di-GMP phosphodiesterase class II)